EGPKAVAEKPALVDRREASLPDFKAPRERIQRMRVVREKVGDALGDAGKKRRDRQERQREKDELFFAQDAVNEEKSPAADPGVARLGRDEQHENIRQVQDQKRAVKRTDVKNTRLEHVKNERRDPD